MSASMSTLIDEREQPGSLPSRTVNAFLKDCYRLCRDKDSPLRHFVIGNEAGDADSIVSAISYAFVSNHSIFSMDKNTDLVRPLPLISTSRADLTSHRPETLYLLQTLAGVSVEDLLFADEQLSSVAQEKEPGNIFSRFSEEIQFTLVDHNKLSETILSSAMGSHVDVVEILDHHRDECSHLNSCPAGERRTIAFENGRAAVASTCTLVTERLISSSIRYPYTGSLSILLLSVILLDSVNQCEDAGKVTDRDRKAIHSLLAFTDWSSLSTVARQELLLDDPANPSTVPNTTLLFNRLQSAKFDPRFWKSLTTHDTLQLDYKQFTVIGTLVGTSTVLLNLNDFIGKSQWRQALRDFMVKRGTNLLLVMLAARSGTSNHLQRQLMLCDRVNGSIINPLVSFLTAPASPLILTECTGIDEVDSDVDDRLLSIRMFDQDNERMSRKQVIPLLIDYFKSRTRTK